MSVLDDVKQVLHRVRVKLYPSNLPENEGKLIARTVNEKTLTYEEVCVAAKERGGYTGSLDNLKEDVAVFLRESAHQLCDGFAINFGGMFSISPNLGGLLENEHEPIDPEKHKITFHFKTLPPLNALSDRIEIISEGLADTNGYIMEITDVTTGQVNDVVTKGGIATITGDRLKVAGDPAKVGVFFYSLGSPNVSIKVAGNLAINDPKRIVFTVPELLAGKNFFVEVRTYYSGSEARPLKEMRTVRSKFMVKQA
ncbi:MAG: DUF4469 domain-containing protein [Spirochaetaceae bacterium]|jgi:hypothetical protein|nr:DUF4469 domain-containing protein [Spirochaetaceae bacterium]